MTSFFALLLFIHSYNLVKQSRICCLLRCNDKKTIYRRGVKFGQYRHYGWMLVNVHLLISMLRVIRPKPCLLRGAREDWHQLLWKHCYPSKKYFAFGHNLAHEQCFEHWYPSTCMICNTCQGIGQAEPVEIIDNSFAWLWWGWFD